MYRAALLLSVLLGLGWVIHDRRAERDASSARLARVAGLEKEAEQACQAGRHVACAETCRRALEHARGVAEPEVIDRLLLCGDRADALAAVAGQVPAGTERSRLRLVAERLAAQPEPAAKALGAALDAALLRASGALVAARASLEKAAKEGLDSPWLQWQGGLVALADRRLADGQAALEKVVQALPEFGAGWHQMGLVSLANDRREAAIAALRKASGLTDDPQVSLDLARAFLAAEMWAEAVGPLEAVLRGRPDEVDAVRLLGLANHNLRRHQAAAELYRKAWTLDRQPRTLLSAALSLHAAGQHSAALDLLTSLLPEAGAVPEVLFVRAAVLADLGRPAESRADYERYLAAAATRPEEAERVKLARARIQ